MLEWHILRTSWNCNGGTSPSLLQSRFVSGARHPPAQYVLPFCWISKLPPQRSSIPFIPLTGTSGFVAIVCTGHKCMQGQCIEVHIWVYSLKWISSGWASRQLGCSYTQVKGQGCKLWSSRCVGPAAGWEWPHHLKFCVPGLDRNFWSREPVHCASRHYHLTVGAPSVWQGVKKPTCINYALVKINSYHWPKPRAE